MGDYDGGGILAEGTLLQFSGVNAGDVDGAAETQCASAQIEAPVDPGNTYAAPTQEYERATSRKSSTVPQDATTDARSANGSKERHTKICLITS